MRKTRKMRSAIVSLLLAFSLAFSMAGTAFAADATDSNGANGSGTYVSLGASNVNGYGLRGYMKAVPGKTIDQTYEAAALDPSIKANANMLGYGSEASGSYPVLVAEELGYDLEQLAISSMRAEELRILLDNEYYGDSYSAWRFVGEGKWFDIATTGGIDTLRAEYQSKIAKADLITVDIGANNFGVYITHQLSSGYAYDNDLALIDPELAELYATAQAYTRELVAQYAPEYSEALRGEKDLVDTMAYALAGFCVNFDIVMEKIYELNPDAEVVVVSVQNLMEGSNMELPGIEGAVPVGELFGALVNAANLYIAMGSPYADSYLCADVRQDGRVECFLEDIVAYDGNPASLSAEIRDCFDVLDGNPGDSYDKGLHVKYMVNKATSGNYTKAMLNAAYDAVASILQAAATIDVLDSSVLEGAGVAEDAFVAAFTEQVMGAVAAAQADPNYDYVLPEGFFAAIADEAGVSVSSVESVAALYVRADIGNTFFGHPNFDGHKTVADAVMTSIEKGITGKEIVSKGKLKGEYEVTENSKYIAIGDATVAKLAEGSNYAQLLAQYIAAVAAEADLAFDPQSANDFAIVGGESLLAEDILAKIESGVWDAQIASADLITLSAGVENLTTAVNSQIIGIAKGYILGETHQGISHDWAAFVGEENVEKVEKAFVSLEAQIAANLGDAAIAAILTDVLECYAYGYAGFATSYVDILDGIREINPDAQIVVVGLNNFFDGFTIAMNGSEVNVGDYFKYIIKLTDTQYLLHAMMTDDPAMTFVSVLDAESDAAGMISEAFEIISKGMPSDTKGKLEFLKVMSNLTALFSGEDSIPKWMPNAAGHQYIYERITGAVDIAVAGAAQSIAGATVKVGNVTYSAEAQKPAVTVTLNGVTLKQGIDYTVAYANNVEVGTATATITGKGAYEGTVKANFQIGHLAKVGLFKDFTNGSWFLDEKQGAFTGLRTLYMDYTLATGLMSGYSGTNNFGPYDNITRGQVAVILYRSECAKDPSLIEQFGSTTDSSKYAKTVVFEDEAPNMYYTAAINWAKYTGIMTGDAGTGYTTVRPNDSVARQELCLMLARFANGGTVPSVELDPAKAAGIKGMNKIADWARDGVYWAVNNGVIGGVSNGDGTFSMDPTGKTWRSAAAKMIAVTVHDVM